MANVKRALISVYDKTGIVEFGKTLAGLGVEILSTGGTAKMLRDAGVEVMDVSDYTGSPEIFEGRLKTLHPKIHGGILYRREDSKHIEQANQNEIGPIDMVVVNLYPFETVVAKSESTFEDAIENIDIGGPTMVRAAAKNHKDVAVVVDPDDYEMIAQELSGDGQISESTLFKLARKAFAVSARYDAAIASYLGGRAEDKSELQMPDTLGFTFSKVMELRYGENPHQKAAFYRDAVTSDEPSMVNAKQLHGKELSYNNIMDADAAIELIKDLGIAPYACAILKHANPCGAAISQSSLSEAFKLAKECDPTSAFGGIIAMNKPIDEETAALIAETFFEVVAAPGYDGEALAQLSKKKNIRLLEVPGLGSSFTPSGWNTRKVTSGLLVQERDLSSLDVKSGKVVTKRQPTDEEWTALNFAWRIVKNVKSNAIVFTKSDRTIGIGAGQMSRVDSSKIAVMKARADLKGTVVASDAFFPFRDGIDEAAKAGATAIVQPGGSVRDEEVIQAADEHGLAMVFTGQRHFGH
jgi:phosphoribosylaminoimidazolecarboxamide formyltransferase/IMP cyclohydrolase